MTAHPQGRADRLFRIIRTRLYRRLRWDNRLLVLACTIGVAGGLVACLYYEALEGLTQLVWKASPLGRIPLPLTTALGGTLVGLAIWRLGAPGEISTLVNNLHLRNGRIDGKQNPSMAVNSLLSIGFGGSAGPEAPLVQLCGSLGSWVAAKLQVRPRSLRIATLSGMASALGAFFGAPLGGAVFALEIPHRRGLEYYEALLPAILSASLAFLVFRGLTPAGVGPIWPFAPHAFRALTDVGTGLGVGLVGAAAAVAFVWLFKLVFHGFEQLPVHPVLRGTLGGLCLGLLSWHHPETLFFSEHQISLLVGAHHSVGGWLLLALIKALAIGVTLGSGFRGGFFFPLFFIGACLGSAVAATVPGLDPQVAMLAGMAAVNVGVTKTPVGTTILLVSLSGLDMLTPILFASLVAFLATLRVGVIDAQRHRPSGELAGRHEADRPTSVDLRQTPAST
ncbi:MAG: chloride channel protein [Deltaproteobacteria bacterium]